MSVCCISHVFKHSVHCGTNLLLLLALADYSDEYGLSYPAVSTLAGKCRMKPRNVNYILRSLVKSGELKITYNTGRYGTNHYQILLNAALHPEQRPSIEPLQLTAETPAVDGSKPLQPIADKPVFNRKEPSTNKHLMDTLFDRFWSSYPKKVGKEAARKSFTRRKPDEVLVVRMLDALSVQSNSAQWKKENGQYIPNPTTWLNQARWDDETVVTTATCGLLAGAI